MTYQAFDLLTRSRRRTGVEACPHVARAEADKRPGYLALRQPPWK